MRIVLHIEYEGTNYGGWQCQENAPSIQSEIERSVHQLTGEHIRIHGAGRTDAGVHALRQVAHFDVNTPIPPDKFAFALNPLLPEDISIKKSFETQNDFHARYSAKGKHYRYVITNTETRPAVWRNFCMHVPYPLNIENMREAASHLIGEHDFASFQAAHSSVKDTVRTIQKLEITKEDDIISIDICGNGFLYNMVRIIAGTLIDAGSGKVLPGSMRDILSACDRTSAGPTAKARGLFLVEVLY